MNISMYVGFSELVKSRGITEAARHAASLGFSSVELLEFVDLENPSLTFKDKNDAAKALKVLRSYGLSVSCLSVCANVVDIYAENPTTVKPVIERLKKCADIAAALECPYLHHTLISHLRLPENAPSYESVLPLALEAAEEVANYCLPLGITCLYEPQGMYFNGVEGYGTFYCEIRKRCQNVGVCYDIGNTLFVDRAPLPFIEKFAHDTMHVHLKNYRLRHPAPDGETCKLRSKSGVCLECVPLRSGDIDITSCLQVLKKAGYNGAFALEDYYDPDATADAIKFVTEIYE